MVSICFCESDMSFLNFCTPTLGSMCQGGICRCETRCLIERAHGRASANVIERHRRDRIGLMAFLALGLEDRRDVLGECRRVRRGLRGRGRRKQDDAAECCCR